MQGAQPRHRPHRPARRVSLARAASVALTAWLAAALMAGCAPIAPSVASSGGDRQAAELAPGAHDPTLIERDGVLHVFTTGNGIQHLRSEDGA